MAQRHHINPTPTAYRPTPSYQPDPIGKTGSGLGGGGNDDFLAKIKGISSKIEDLIEGYTQVSLSFFFLILLLGFSWQFLFGL